MDKEQVIEFLKSNSNLIEIEVVEETEEISMKFCGEEIFGFNSDFIEM